MQILLWIVTGVLSFVMPLIVWLAKTGFNRIISKFDELIRQNYYFNAELIKQGGKISNLTERIQHNEKRLENHSERIRILEIKDIKGKDEAK